MIYDVRVTTYTPDGIVKKVVTGKSLSDKMWEEILDCSKYATRLLKAKPEKTCLICQRKFQGVPHSKFCSPECSKENVRENYKRNYIARSLEKHSNAEVVDGRLVFNIKCRVCKRILQMRTANGIFCSRKCSSNRYNDKYIQRIRAEVKAEKAKAESSPDGQHTA